MSADPFSLQARALTALRRGQGRVGAGILVSLTLLAVVGPALIGWAMGADFAQQNLALSAVPPSWSHPFGTDSFGRDLLMRCLSALRISLAVGLCAACISVCLGTLYGSLAGYVGGRVDGLMMRAVDVLYALPFIFLVIVLTCIFGRSMVLLFIGLGAVSWLTCARVVRAQVMALRGRDFVAALELMGAGSGRILLLHLVPNTLGVAVVMFTLSVPAMVLEEAFLSFVGLGVQAPAASLGSLLSDGAAQMLLCWWQLVFPAATLTLLLLALNFVGDALQQALDPKH